MKEVLETARSHAWLRALPSDAVQKRIHDRIRRLASGNPGQHRVLRGGVREPKIDTGPGYRVYYAERGLQIVLLLVGGDKSTQRADIEAAISLATSIRS